MKEIIKQLWWEIRNELRERDINIGTIFFAIILIGCIWGLIEAFFGFIQRTIF